MEKPADSTQIEDRIADYLAVKRWVANVQSVTFLAAGEYNENYLVNADGNRYVFRVNRGTQLGLDNQIEYEFGALNAVQPSGVTPLPYFVDGAAPGLGEGVLLMEYIPGTTFVYHRDWQSAAEVFARIHQLPTSDGLIVQRRAVASIVEESLGLLDRFDSHPRADVGARIRSYLGTIDRLAERYDAEFAGEDLCIVNTEVNSGNFIVSPDRVVLVDWEKAVASCRYQDLAHFLVATTTLWKSDYRFSPEKRRAFLSSYYSRITTEMSLDEIDERTDVLERTILLRAYSWCFMAYAEYVGSNRPITNPDTFDRIIFYLDHTHDFLGV